MRLRPFALVLVLVHSAIGGALADNECAWALPHNATHSFHGGALSDYYHFLFDFTIPVLYRLRNVVEKCEETLVYVPGGVWSRINEEKKGCCRLASDFFLARANLVVVHVTDEPLMRTIASAQHQGLTTRLIDWNPREHTNWGEDNPDAHRYFRELAWKFARVPAVVRANDSVIDLLLIKRGTYAGTKRSSHAASGSSRRSLAPSFFVNATRLLTKLGVRYHVATLDNLAMTTQV